MGFDDLDHKIFVKELDENLLCIICQQVYKNPTVVCQNGHCFCGDCIAVWEVNHSDCPECREPIQCRVLNRPLQTIIMALDVKCEKNNRYNALEKKEEYFQSKPKRARLKSEDDGKHALVCCSWEGKLGDYLERHRKLECGFRMVRCPTCNISVMASDLQTHGQLDCPSRCVLCNLCNSSVLASALAAHQRTTCPNWQVACPHCQKIMPRKQLGTAVLDETEACRYACTGHLEVCPHLPVYCEFHTLGCAMGKLKRQDLAKHHTEAAASHVQLVGPTLRSIQNGNHWMQKSLQWDIPHTKFVQIRNGGVESQRFRMGDYQVFFRFLESIDGTLEVKICTRRTEGLGVPLIDRVQIDSLWGNHTCQIQQPTPMELDPDDNAACSVTGTLRIDVQEGDNSPIAYCRVGELVSGVDSRGFYSLEVQFRLKAPSTLHLQCV